MLEKIGYTLVAITLVLLSTNIGVSLGQADLTVFNQEQNPSYINEDGEIYLSETDQEWIINTIRKTTTEGKPDIFNQENREIYITIHSNGDYETFQTDFNNIEALNLDIKSYETIEINLPNNSTEISNTESINAIERGIHGISLDGHTLLPHVAIIENLTNETFFEELCLASNLDSNCAEDESNQFYKFTTFNFIETDEGSIILDRYNTYPTEISSDEFITSLDLAAERIKNDFSGTEKFNYAYYPSDDTYSDKYNMPRHIYGSYTLIELYKYYGDESYLEDAKKSIDWFMDYVITEGDMSYITYNGYTKLGSVAMAIIALTDYKEVTGDTSYDELMAQLANFAIFMQDEDGGYRNYYPEADYDNTFATALYTGEINLGLARLYRDTGEEKYLETIEKSYYWVEEYFDRKHSPAIVSWNSSAYLIVYELTEDEKYAEATFKMTDYLIDNRQYDEEMTPFDSYIGAFLVNGVDDGLTCSAAAYGEGLVDAYELAVIMGDIEHQEKYKESTHLAVEFLISMQFTDENTFYLETPERAIGGFRSSMYQNDIKVDSNCHAMSTYLKAVENNIY